MLQLPNLKRHGCRRLPSLTGCPSLPSTHPKRQTRWLSSSRLLKSNMCSSPSDRMISRSSKLRSVSGTSSALWGREERTVQRCSHATTFNTHLSTRTWPSALSRYWQTGKGSPSPPLMECKRANTEKREAPSPQPVPFSRNSEIQL